MGNHHHCLLRPPIGVYTSENIDQQLDTAAQNFIQHEVQINQSALTLQLSRIFYWYQVDFGGRKNLVSFITQFHPERDWLLANQKKLKIKFSPYHWGLNV